MSGLLVKSHADHAREPRGAERPRPRRHPGAPRRRRAHPHLRRARPARGLRGPPLLRQGRLRGPARHGPPRRDQARRRRRPRPGAGCPAEPSCRARSRARGRDGDAVEPARPLARGRHRQPGLHAAVPRLQGRQGHRRSTTSPATSTRPPCSATSGSSAPRRRPTARPRPTTSSRPASARSCASSWRRPRPTGMLVPAGRLRLLRRQLRRRRPRHLDRRDRAPPSWPASTSPASSKAPLPLHRRLLPPGRLGRGRLRRVPHRHHGPAGSASVTAELFAADKYQEYLLLHGLGVEMAEALAEYWHRRIREEWGFADEDGPSLAGLFRQQYRGGRYSWGYPACPDLEDNETVGRAARRRPHRHRGATRRPASSTSPSRPPRPSSATTRRRSTSSPADPAGSQGKPWARAERGLPP